MSDFSQLLDRFSPAPEIGSELLESAKCQEGCHEDRGINGGAPRNGEESVYAAKAS